LKKRAITIKTGTLVDATIIASASKDDRGGLVSRYSVSVPISESPAG